MNKILLPSLLILSVFAGAGANARVDDEKFLDEVRRGLDIVTAHNTLDTVADDADGELGMDVYQKKGVVDTKNTNLFIPTTMYVRMGGGLNLGFASSEVHMADGTKSEMSAGWGTQIGLGFNMSSYVRTELDFQTTKFGVSDDKGAIASARQFGGTLYFDFARRYVMNGDITTRRTFVPFMGLGAGVGMYGFDGAGGAHGVFLAPRGILGFNVMFNDLVGIDLAYQYQIFVGNGMGWNAPHGGLGGMSDIMLTLRVNF
jgi:hypothetical protein